jgi:hypothetical protein
LSDVLAREGAHVADVSPGLRPHVHRLVLRDTAGHHWATAVVATRADAAAGIEAERQLLDEVATRPLGALRETLPQPLASAEHAGLPVLITTAPPRLSRPGPTTSRIGKGPEAAVVAGWLTRWWDATGSGFGPTGFGTGSATALAAAGAGARTVQAVADAAAELRGFRVLRATEHGCLCRRHLRYRRGAVWVEDWGVGQQVGEPLRDLSTYALSMAGRDVGGVLHGSAAATNEVRDLLGAGLAHLGLPPRLWRVVLFLALADRVTRTRDNTTSALAELEPVAEASEGTP